MNDFRFAFRQLLKNPGFAAVAAISIAIGIGANTTIFSVANALLFRTPTGVREPSRLVDLGRSKNGHGFNPNSYPNYVEIRARTRSLEGVYACSFFPQRMSLGVADPGAGIEPIFGTFVTPNYFTLLGAVPAVGQFFSASDGEAPGGDPVVVLSHRFWVRRFNHDPGIVGRKLTINRQPFTVVGIAAEGFQGTGVRAGDLWLPTSMVAVSQGAGLLANRDAGWLLIGGRLKPDVSVPQAEAEVDAIGRTLASDFPEQNRDTGLRLSPASPVPGNGGAIAAFMALLMGLVSMVLAVACANLASVLLARALIRRREIAVRLAIGAGRARLVRQLLTETLTLFALGGVFGLIMARGMTSALVALLPSLPFPVDVSLALNGRVLLFTSGLVFVSALLSGLAPALHGSRTDVVRALKDDMQGPSRMRLRQGFVVVQLALSILLVTIASLFTRALQHVDATAPGFDPQGVELVAFDLTLAGYTDATGPLFARELVARARMLPGVQSATIAAVLPGGFEGIGLGGLAAPDSLVLGGDSISADWNIVEPGYFSTLRMSLLAGRDFNTDDCRGSQRVAIIGEGAAKRLWPGQDAIGRFVLQERGGTKIPLLVVGIARDPKFGSLVDRTTGTFVYLPLQQGYLAGWTTLVARMAPGHHLADELRGLVTLMSPGLPIANTQTAEDYAALGLLAQRLVASVSGSLGLVGLFLAALGVYGVTAYAVARRTREIGIRMAMGAPRADVVRMILRQGLSLVAIGSTIGLLLASAFGHLLQTFLLGIAPMDSVAFLGAAALFAIIGFTACYIPARRAARIDPMMALRSD
jgi:predicted permease